MWSSIRKVTLMDPISLWVNRYQGDFYYWLLRALMRAGQALIPTHPSLVVASVDPLFECLPSTVDLTSSCLATLECRES
jgi:hypothetical protein